MIPPFGEWIDRRIFSLSVGAFRDYLLAHGWTMRTSPFPQTLVFAGPQADDGEPFVITIPASEEAVDFRARVDDFFRRLSILEERHPTEILEEMLRQTESQRLIPNGKNGARRSKSVPRNNKRVAKK